MKNGRVIVAIDFFKGCRRDRQTLTGKLPYGILQKAKARHVPVVLIAGRVCGRQQLFDAGFTQVEWINPPAFPIEEAMNPETANRNIPYTCGRMMMS